jgi:hypothetical protein
MAVIRSDPVEVSLTQASVFADRGYPGTDGFQWQFETSFDAFWDFTRIFSRNAVGLVIGGTR